MENYTSEEQFGTVPQVCPNCNAAGFTVETHAECCGRAENECCGIPEPVEVQVQCSCDRGYVPTKPTKENSYLDLRKCSEQERKQIPSILSNENVFYYTDLFSSHRQILHYGISQCEYGWLSATIDADLNKQEISFPQFCELFQDEKAGVYYPGKDYQELFDHLQNEHGLTLLESEMSEIIRISSKGKEVLQVEISNEKLERIADRFLAERKISQASIWDTEENENYDLSCLLAEFAEIIIKSKNQ